MKERRPGRPAQFPARLKKASGASGDKLKSVATQSRRSVDTQSAQFVNACSVIRLPNLPRTESVERGGAALGGVVREWNHQRVNSQSYARLGRNLALPASGYAWLIARVQVQMEQGTLQEGRPPPRWRALNSLGDDRLRSAEGANSWNAFRECRQSPQHGFRSSDYPRLVSRNVLKRLPNEVVLLNPKSRIAHQAAQLAGPIISRPVIQKDSP